MDKIPDSPHHHQSAKLTIYTFGLAICGIALGVMLWVILGNAGVEQFVQIVLAICAPPGIVAAILGVYLLLRAGNHRAE